MAPPRGGWGGTSDSWDDWDRSDGNPQVAMTDDDVQVEDYRPAAAATARAPKVQAPQPTRAGIPTTPVSAPSPSSDDIYDFQVTPTVRSTPPSSSPAPAPNGRQAAAGWDDWDDWSRGK